MDTLIKLFLKRPAIKSNFQVNEREVIDDRQLFVFRNKGAEFLKQKYPNVFGKYIQKEARHFAVGVDDLVSISKDGKLIAPIIYAMSFCVWSSEDLASWTSYKQEKKDTSDPDKLKPYIDQFSSDLKIVDQNLSFVDMYLKGVKGERERLINLERREYGVNPGRLGYPAYETVAGAIGQLKLSLGNLSLKIGFTEADLQRSGLEKVKDTKESLLKTIKGL